MSDPTRSPRQQFTLNAVEGLRRFAASQKVGSKRPDEIGTERKSAKIFKVLFLQTQMAAPVELKPFRTCLGRPLKSRKVSLSSITIYKFSKRKTIAVGFPRRRGLTRSRYI